MKNRAMQTGLAGQPSAPIARIERRLFLGRSLSLGALALLSGPDREERRAAAEAVTEALSPGLRTRAYIFNTLRPDLTFSAIVSQAKVSFLSSTLRKTFLYVMENLQRVLLSSAVLS